MKNVGVYIIGILVVLLLALGGFMFSVTSTLSDGYIFYGDSGIVISNLTQISKTDTLYKNGDVAYTNTKYNSAYWSFDKFESMPLRYGGIALSGNDLSLNMYLPGARSEGGTGGGTALILSTQNFDGKKFRANIEVTLRGDNVFLVVGTKQIQIPVICSNQKFYSCSSKGLLEVVPKILDAGTYEIFYQGESIGKIVDTSSNMKIGFYATTSNKVDRDINLKINNPRWQYLFEECVVRSGETLTYQTFDANVPFSVLTKPGVSLVGMEGNKDLGIERFCLNKPAIIYSAEGFTTTSEVYQKLITGETVSYGKKIGVYYIASNVGTTCSDGIYNVDLGTCGGDILFEEFKALKEQLGTKEALIQNLSQQAKDLNKSLEDKQLTIYQLNAQLNSMNLNNTELANLIDNLKMQNSDINSIVSGLNLNLQEKIDLINSLESLTEQQKKDLIDKTSMQFYQKYGLWFGVIILGGGLGLYLFLKRKK